MTHFSLVINDHLLMSDEALINILLLLDLSLAFDTVSNDKLLCCLIAIGTALTWFSSYLKTGSSLFQLNNVSCLIKAFLKVLSLDLLFLTFTYCHLVK